RPAHSAQPLHADKRSPQAAAVRLGLPLFPRRQAHRVAADALTGTQAWTSGWGSNLGRACIGHCENSWTRPGLTTTIHTVTNQAERRTPSSTSPKSVRFVELSSTAMIALLNDDLAQASAETGVALTEYFVTDTAKWVWRYRVNQLTSDPGCA